MNIILACVLFVVVGMVGKDFAAPVVGGTVPGSPAASATVSWENAPPVLSPATAPTSAASTYPATGFVPAVTIEPWKRHVDPLDPHLQPGDTIVEMYGDSFVLSLNHNKIDNMFDYSLVALLSKRGETYKFKIERTVNGQKYVGIATSGVMYNEMMQFGIESAHKLTVKYDKEFAAAVVEDIAPFEDKDKMTALNGQSVSDDDWGDVERFDLSLADDSPVTVTVKRGDQDKSFEHRPHARPQRQVSLPAGRLGLPRDHPFHRRQRRQG